MLKGKPDVVDDSKVGDLKGEEEKNGDLESNENDYPLSREGYELEAIMGRGGFGVVYSAKCKKNNKMVAIKAIDLESESHSPSDDVFDLLHKEVSKMKALKSEHTLAHFASFVANDQIWIVMPKMVCSCQQLMSHCKKEFGKGILCHDNGKILLCRIIKDVVNGLCVMHEIMMHRDIKPGNILIGKNGIIKLADFGVSVDIIESGILKKERNTMVGTLEYMSNEVANPLKKYTKKADIFAFGQTCYQLAFNKIGNRKLIIENKYDDLWKTANENYKDNKDGIDSNFRKFVEKCLSNQEKDRPSAQELLKFKYLKNVSDDNEKEVTKARSLIVENIVTVYETFESKMLEKAKEKAQKEKEKESKDEMENTQTIDQMVVNDIKIELNKNEKDSNNNVAKSDENETNNETNNEKKNEESRNEINLPQKAPQMNSQVSESIDFEKI